MRHSLVLVTLVFSCTFPQFNVQDDPGPPAGGTPGANGGAAGGARAEGGAPGGVDEAGSPGLDGASGAPPLEELSIEVGTEKYLTAQEAPNIGGVDYNDACPNAQVLIGFNGTLEAGQPHLKSIAGVCATLSVDGKAPYAVVTSRTGALPARQAAGLTDENTLCPEHHVVVGFSGRRAQYVEALTFHCARLSVSANGSVRQLSLATPVPSQAIGDESAGTAFAPIYCEPGQVATGQAPKAGAFIDKFGLSCSAVRLVLVTAPAPTF